MNNIKKIYMWIRYNIIETLINKYDFSILRAIEANDKKQRRIVLRNGRKILRDYEFFETWMTGNDRIQRGLDSRLLLVANTILAYQRRAGILGIYQDFGISSMEALESRTLTPNEGVNLILPEFFETQGNIREDLKPWFRIIYNIVTYGR